ncbi:MAG: GrdX family protein [Senegalia sp. (in: firmicutes)]|uniref:GrdX family protein n=1 Tax=Senegalia sp. (in: firmicutes) TaxID=1924098 RepID=UPI003F999FC8
MKQYLITNNSLVHRKYSEEYEVDYLDVSYMDILKYVRDKIHSGHILLTHPLSGSIKPNETPYKTVIISKEKRNLDMKSLMIIEDSISTADKFINKIGMREFDLKSSEDFKVIDLSLVEESIKR